MNLPVMKNIYVPCIYRSIIFICSPSLYKYNTLLNILVTLEMEEEIPFTLFFLIEANLLLHFREQLAPRIRWV